MQLFQKTNPIQTTASLIEFVNEDSLEPFLEQCVSFIVIAEMQPRIIIEHKDENAFREESHEPTVEEETYSPEKGDEGVEENVVLLGKKVFRKLS
jgi:hypothetical protein